MGYLLYTKEKISQLIKQHKIKTVADLGSQNDYSTSYKNVPPFISEWYKDLKIEYVSIDMNGENDSLQWDLSEPVKTNKKYDMVVDCGTSEHVRDLYQCFANVDKLTKPGGIMVHENPKTGNWPEHGLHYFTKEFYTELAKKAGYKILFLEDTFAMHNYDTGGNIFCAMKKGKNEFISEEEFPKTEKA